MKLRAPAADTEVAAALEALEASSQAAKHEGGVGTEMIAFKPGGASVICLTAAAS